MNSIKNWCLNHEFCVRVCNRNLGEMQMDGELNQLGKLSLW
jgi:hypothetical protein